MAHILVLSGGTSGEREVSLRSGIAVAEALKAQSHTVKMADPAHDNLAEAIQGCDAVFPVLHGKGGEDGTIQAELEALGIPYVGANSTSSALCFDKWRYKQLLRDHKLPVPDGALVESSTIWDSPFVRQPFVLKPYDGGSSIDTFIVRDVTDIPRAGIEEAFGRCPSMLIEPLVDGQEITVSVLGEQALPVIEIIPPANSEFDYDNKYNGKTQELCPPQNISEAIQEKASHLAETIHFLTGVRDMSRTDMIVAADGSLYVLETNTIPGLTAQSLYPKSAAAAGLSMPQLTGRLVHSALTRGA